MILHAVCSCVLPVGALVGGVNRMTRGDAFGDGWHRRTGTGLSAAGEPFWGCPRSNRGTGTVVRPNVVARPGVARRGLAGRGQARQGCLRHGSANGCRWGSIPHPRTLVARLGVARLGVARRGEARRGRGRHICWQHGRSKGWFDSALVHTFYTRQGETK